MMVLNKGKTDKALTLAVNTRYGIYLRVTGKYFTVSSREDQRVF